MKFFESCGDNSKALRVEHAPKFLDPKELPGTWTQTKLNFFWAVWGSRYPSSIAPARGSLKDMDAGALQVPCHVSKKYLSGRKGTPEKDAASQPLAFRTISLATGTGIWALKHGICPICFVEGPGLHLCCPSLAR